MKKLAPKQKEIYQEILDYMYKFKIPPTIDYLRIMFDYKSNNSVQEHLLALKNKGYIKSHKGQNRTIVITNDKICSFCRRSNQDIEQALD